MTNQPMIKKYRRKVSEEYVRQIYNNSIINESHIGYLRGLRITKKVIDAISQSFEGKLETVTRYRFLGKEYETIEQFHAEWEEIPK